jgi:hypothetical protein
LTFLTRETKQDFYLAQIAAEVRRSNMKNPGSIKVKDFLLTFRTAAEAKSAKSKKIWAKALQTEIPDV